MTCNIPSSSILGVLLALFCYLFGYLQSVKTIAQRNTTTMVYYTKWKTTKRAGFDYNMLCHPLFEFRTIILKWVYTIQVHSTALLHHLSACFSLTPSLFVYCFTPQLPSHYFCCQSSGLLSCIGKQPTPLVLMCNMFGSHQ